MLPKTAIARSHRLIAARLGAFPRGCEYTVSNGRGSAPQPVRQCPRLGQCRALPADQPVLCELEDHEIALRLRPRPDEWLGVLHAALRPLVMRLDRMDFAKIDAALDKFLGTPKRRTRNRRKPNVPQQASPTEWDRVDVRPVV